MLEYLFEKVGSRKARYFINKSSCFPTNIAKFLRLPMLKNISEQLFLTVLMAHWYIGLKFQGLDCIKVQVTGLRKGSINKLIIRKGNTNNLIIGQLNISSLRNEFDCLVQQIFGNILMGISSWFQKQN